MLKDKIELDKPKREEAYVDSIKDVILGCINGIIFYSFIYSLVIEISLITLFGGVNNMKNFYNSHEHLLSILMSLLVSALTLTIAVVIAKPKKLIKAFNKIGLDEIKTIFASFAMIYAFNIIYNSAISMLGVDVSSGNTNQTTIEDYIQRVPALSFITFVLIGPLLEEVTYRYFLFGGIRKISPKWAIIISGFIFMLAHGLVGFISGEANTIREILLLPPYMFSGCILAYCYSKHDNLAVSTGVHLLNNFLSFTLTLLLLVV